MQLELAMKIFEALIIAALLFIGEWLRKKFKPTVKAIKRMSEVSDRVDDLEEKVIMLNGRQHSLIYIDPQPIFIFNEKAEVKSVNPAFLEMTGFTNEKEALGVGFLKAIPKENRQETLSQIDDFVKHGGTFASEIILQNIDTKEIIKTYCRIESIKNKEVIIEAVGTLKQI